MRARTLVWCCLWSACQVTEPVSAPDESVGRYADGRQVTPVNQSLTPYGRLIDLPGLRPQVLAQSKDGSRLYVSGKTSQLLVLDAASGEVVQTLHFPKQADRSGPNDKEVNPDRAGQASYTGLAVAPDGQWIYLSNVDGQIAVFGVKPDGSVQAARSLVLPPANAPRRKAEIPSGLAVSADGSQLWVCGNLSNKLLQIDSRSGALIRSFDVGVAPYDVVVVGGRAFVSNWGGRRPATADVTGPAGRGTLVRVDPVRRIEDDPQAGWDHVSGYRTTCYIASPYAKRGVTVSTQYNTTSILRTIEQILGIPPMNVFDASATPMFDCFQDQADLTAFTALPATIPIDTMNPRPSAIADPQQRADAELSASLNLAQVDKAPEGAFNRILWRAMRGGAPYPEWASWVPKGSKM